MKKILALILIAILTLSLLAGCGGSKASDGSAGPKESAAPETGSPAEDGGKEEAPAEPVTIKVGASPTPHAEILAVIKDSLAEKGYQLEIVEFADYVLPNTALRAGNWTPTTSSTCLTSPPLTLSTGPTWCPWRPSTTSPSASSPAKPSPLTS